MELHSCSARGDVCGARDKVLPVDEEGSKKRDEGSIGCVESGGGVQSIDERLEKIAANEGWGPGMSGTANFYDLAGESLAIMMPGN